MRGELVHEQPLGNGKFKRYQIGQNPSTLMVRVRGFHMKEVHATAAHVGPLPATLFDIGVHLANNGKYLQDHNLAQGLAQNACIVEEPVLVISLLLARKTK